MAVLLVFGVSVRSIAIFESFGDSDVERREVLEQVLDEAHRKRLVEVDNRMRRLARRGQGSA